MRLVLEEVTLVCIDTRNIEAAIYSMSVSLKDTKFARSILFTSEGLCSKEIRYKTEELGIQIETIPKINSISEYSYFILANLEQFIQTQFCLVTQWDGWIVNNKKWNSNFLKYDYIGAVWPQYTFNQIGNGGFSLRSKKLLKSAREILFNDSDIPKKLIEDDYICRRKRAVLEEKFQIKFSNVRLANNFSIEGSKPSFGSFGFHGMSNFYFAISKDKELEKLIDLITDDNLRNRESYVLIQRLIKQNRIEIAKMIMERRLKANGYSKKHIKLIFFIFARKFLPNFSK